MTAAEIWAKFGGLIDNNEKWLLVNLHQIDDVRANKPLKNIRFPYQIMMNDSEQSLPVQFRSLKNAREFFHGEMTAVRFDRLLTTGKARMFFGPAT